MDKSITDLKKKHDEHVYGKNKEDMPWRALFSWFSWGSPIGLGFFVISIGLFILLLHLAGLIGIK